MTMPAHPYASQDYANAFVPAFVPVYLEAAKTYILKRAIPDTPYFDAIGCYPLCVMAENADLQSDFATLKEQGIVSLVIVTDPFFHPALAVLEGAFTRVIPYKKHYLHDFSKDRTYNKHHRYEVRRALKKLEVRRIALSEHLDAWGQLYQGLVTRHGIKGIQAFSQDYFKALSHMNPPMFGAFYENVLVGAHLCVEYQGHAYSHLGASSEEGYRLNAAYAIYDFMLNYFAEHGAKLFDLGAGAGLTDTSDGLTQFKKGFSNADAICYLCCKILDENLYAELSKGKETTFFPAYRG